MHLYFPFLSFHFLCLTFACFYCSICKLSLTLICGLVALTSALLHLLKVKLGYTSSLQVKQNLLLESHSRKFRTGFENLKNRLASRSSSLSRLWIYCKFSSYVLFIFCRLIQVSPPLYFSCNLLFYYLKGKIHPKLFRFLSHWSRFHLYP